MNAKRIRSDALNICLGRTHPAACRSYARDSLSQTKHLFLRHDEFCSNISCPPDLPGLPPLLCPAMATAVPIFNTNFTETGHFILQKPFMIGFVKKRKKSI